MDKSIPLLLAPYNSKSVKIKFDGDGNSGVSGVFIWNGSIHEKIPLTTLKFHPAVYSKFSNVFDYLRSLPLLEVRDGRLVPVYSSC